MLVAVQRHQHLIHEDLALVIEGLLEIVNAQCMFDIVVSADAMNFHSALPISVGKPW